MLRGEREMTSVPRYLVLGAVLLQVSGDAILGHGEARGAFDRMSVPTPIQPPDWAFAIWGLIFAGQLIFAAAQALPRYAALTLFPPLRGPSVGLFLATFGWLAAATYGPAVLTIPLIFVALALAAWLFVVAARTDDPTAPAWLRWVTVGCFGLAAGWLAVAAPLNVASLLPALSVRASPYMVAVSMLSLAGLIGLLLIRATHSPLPVTAALTWGFTSLLISLRDGNRLLLWLVVGLAGLLLLATAAQTRASRRVT